MIRTLLLIGLSISISACQLSRTLPANLLTAQDVAMTARMERARDRLVEALTVYEQMPALAAALCNAKLCGTVGVVCQSLSALAIQPDRLDYVRRNLLTPAELARAKAALLAADFQATSNPDLVKFEGVVQDAYTNGNRVLALTERFATRDDDAVAVMIGHEIHHVLGRLDTGAAGPFSEWRDAINSASSCYFSLAKGLESASPIPVQWETVFSDTFLANAVYGSILGPAWFPRLPISNGLLVFGGPSSPGFVETLLKDFSARDVRIKARAEAWEGSDLRFEARRQSADTYYAAKLSGSTTIQAQLIAVRSGVVSVLATADVPGTENQAESVIFEAVGTSLKLNLNGVPLLEVTDTGILTAGGAGITATSGYVDEFLLEKVMGAP